MKKIFAALMLGCLLCAGCATTQQRHIKLLREKTELVTELRKQNNDLGSKLTEMKSEVARLEKKFTEIQPSEEEVQLAEDFQPGLRLWARLLGATLSQRLEGPVTVEINEFVFLDNNDLAVVVSTVTSPIGVSNCYALFYRTPDGWKWANIDFVPLELSKAPLPSQEKSPELMPMPEDTERGGYEEL